MLLRRLVLAYVDHAVEIFLEELLIRRRRLDADNGSLEQRLHLVDHRLGGGFVIEVKLAGEVGLRERARLADGESRRVDGVGTAEIDDLQPLVGNEHRRHDGVELARRQTWDEAVPVLNDDRTFDLHPRAEIVGEIDLKSGRLAIRPGEVPRRVSALGGDRDGGRLVLSLRPARKTKHGERQCCDSRCLAEDLHSSASRS